MMSRGEGGTESRPFAFSIASHQISGKGENWNHICQMKRLLLSQAQRLSYRPPEFVAFPDDFLLHPLNRTPDLNVLLSSLQNLPAWHTHGKVVRIVVARDIFEAILARSVNQPPDIAPIDCSGAHDTRFPCTIHCACPEIFLSIVDCSKTGERAFGVLDMRDAEVTEKDGRVVWCYENGSEGAFRVIFDTFVL